MAKKIELHGGIHTMEVWFPQEIPAQRGIKTGRPIMIDGGQIVYPAKINLNKIVCNSDTYINSWQEYSDYYYWLLDCFKITDTMIRRVDFRIDNYNDNFSDVRKINSALMYTLAATMGADPTRLYSSSRGCCGNEFHNLIFKKSNKYTVECYDRLKCDGKDGLTKTRLEFRSLLANCEFKEIPAIAEEWIYHLKAATSSISDYYKQAQKAINENLFEYWQQKVAAARKTPVKSFVQEQQDLIFSPSQMVELCQMLGIKKNKAYNYSSELGIPYLSKKDLSEYARDVITALNVFF